MVVETGAAHAVGFSKNGGSGSYACPAASTDWQPQNCYNFVTSPSQPALSHNTQKSQDVVLGRMVNMLEQALSKVNATLAVPGKRSILQSAAPVITRH